MDLKLFFTRRKILALILIGLLLSLLYIIARHSTIINEPVPLSSVNIEAMFYVEMPGTGTVVCVGDGLVSTSEDTSGEQAVDSKIVTAPDNSAYLGNNYHVVWNSIRQTDEGLRVYGYTADGAAPTGAMLASYSNVEELKAANLEAGEIVTTKGYYTPDDGGTSEYLIAAAADKNALDNIQLKNGLYAVLKINDVLNVKQLGAVGDGVADDTEIIKKALKSKVPTVNFAPGTYLCTKHMGIKTNDLTVNGNNSAIITNDKFNGGGWKEWFITFYGSNITINDLQFIAKETKEPQYKTQVCGRNITNFKLYNCKFIIPNTVWSDRSDYHIEYSNLDFFTDWHYVTVDHCYFENYSGNYAGVNCEIRDINMSGCNDAVFTNNECHHNTRDEIFSLFTYGDANTINNVTITNNKFYELPCPKYTRYVGLSLGYDSYGRGANNVTFTDNYFEGYADYNYLKIAYSANVLVERNEFVCHLEDGSSTLTLIRGSSTDTNIHIQNNNFTVVNDGFKALKSFASGNMTLTNNNLTTNVKFKNKLFESNAIDNNNIVTNAY